MQGNRRSSSSEQYIKKSNRTLLFGGIILLIVFLMTLVFMSGGGKHQEEQSELDYKNMEPGISDNDITSADPFGRGDAQLVAEPAQVEMNNVVIGSKVEAIVTLTAKNTPVRFLKMEFAEQQADGFTTETTCSSESSIAVDKSCSIKIFWNPVALQQLQNPLIITWKEDSETSFREKTTTIIVKGQSTDSKDCIICEDIRNKEAAEPRYAMGLDGKLYEMDEDGNIIINGKKVKMNEYGLFVDEDGNIVAIAPPEYIAVDMNNEVIGSVSSTTNEVIDMNGEKIGKTLGDQTIVDTQLNILGAGVPVLSVMDSKGNVIGKMTKEGTVVDGTGTVIGKVWVDQQVATLDGKPFAYVRPWGLVADFSGKILGGIIPDGSVINGKNETIANITPNGFAINAQGELIGATIPQGVAVGPGCQSLGKVLQNGEVRDSYDQVIGTALIDGTIVNSEKEEVGAVISQGIVINEKGEAVGYVNSEGKAVSAAGKVIGCINPDGTISAGKKIIGAVLAKGHVIGYQCGAIGSVFPTGEVYDNTLQKVGRVMPDGFVKNSENKIIGLVVTRAAAVADGCRLLGLVSINGQVLDLTNQVVGCMTPEKTVIDDKGETIGSIAMRGVVYRDDGSVLGRARFDGKVMDLEGNVIGCINADGSITSLTGELLASAAANKRDKGGIITDADGNPTGWTRIGNDIYDQFGNKIGTVNKNDVIVDATGKYIGFIPPDGVIFSPDGLILGRYSSKVGYAVNQANERFGKVLPNLAVVSADTGEVVGGLIADKTAFIDKNGTLLGQVNVEGVLSDASGTVAGAVRGDGTVIDKEGAIIGWAVPSGDVFSTTGKELGSVSQTGEVLSNGRTKIGSVLGNGIAISTDGKILGGVLPKMALAMDATGLIGYLAPDGKITDLNGTVIGNGTPFGPVLASDGSVIGKLVGFDVYVDNQNTTVGWLVFEGVLKSKDNRVIGAVTTNGMAYDKGNNLLGSAIKLGPVTDETGNLVSMMAINNKVLIKDKFLGAGSASPYIYATDDKPLGRILKPGVAVNNEGELIGWTRADGSIGTQKEALGSVLYDNRVINERGSIIGGYIPFSAVAVDDTGKTIGVVSKNGEITTINDSTKGKIHGADIVVQNGDIVARLMCEMPFISNNLFGKTSGLAQFNGEVVNMSNKKSIGNLLMNGFAMNSSGQIVASETAQGIPVTNALSPLGQSNIDGSVSMKNAATGRLSGIKAIYDESGKILGSVLPSSTYISKTGTVIGQAAASRQIIDKNGKLVAGQMTHGIALTEENIWAGGLMPKGLAVNDDAQAIGTVMPDGIVLDGSDSIVARVLSDGAVIPVTDKELFNTMPYAGSVVVQGMPFSYRNKVLGYTTLNGDVKDPSGAKLFRILDDGTILGKDEPLAGAILPYLPGIGYKGEVLGVLSGDGKVLTPDGESKGTIAVNETVKAGELKIVGSLVPTRTITNDCKVVGMVSYNGQVVDGKGSFVGHIRPDRWAVNAAGNRIGRVTRNGLVIAENGDYLGRTLSDSTVVDLSGVNMGCAQNDGTVVDNNGNVIGKVVERGLVLGKDGKPLGRIKADGTVVNKNGEVIGKVLANGDVVDKNGNVIGHNISRDQELLFDENGNIKGTFGSDGTFYDPKTGQAVFRVDGETGNVYDPKGNLIGKLDEDGRSIRTLDGERLDNLTVLMDKNGNVFGIVSGCDVKNAFGEKIGSILANGNVVDLNGEVFAKILGDGTILDKDGNEFGRVAGTETRLDKCGIKTLTEEERRALEASLAAEKILKNLDNLTDAEKEELADLLAKLREKGLDGLTEEERRRLAELLGKMGLSLDDLTEEQLRELEKALAAEKALKNIDNLTEAEQEELADLLAKLREKGLAGLTEEERRRLAELLGKMGLNLDDLTEEQLLAIADALAGRNKGRGRSGGISGRSIILGNKKYHVSDKGSIIADDGTIIGYIGEDGKPYTLDNRVLTASGDMAGRTRPNIEQKTKLTPEQMQQIQDMLAQKRENMRAGIAERGKITAGGNIKAMSRQKKDARWAGIEAIVSSWPVDMSRMILKDKAIPAVIVRSIDSRFTDVPVTAIVERHVYAEQGRNILIPAGSRIIGRLQGAGSGMKVAKMQIQWERLIRPDGGAFKFQATSGDAQGRAGVAAYLDEQLIEKYGKPVMSSVITSAISYMMAVNDDYTVSREGSSTQSAKAQAANDAREHFIGTMDRIFNQLLEDATNIPVVVYVPSGTRITVFSNEDLWLRAEEDDMEEYRQSEDFKDMTQAQKPQTNSWVEKRNTPSPAPVVSSNTQKKEEKPKEAEQNKAPTPEKPKEELPNYYAPNEAYKGADSSNTPIYDGLTTEDIPLKDRTATPVLPKTGTPNRLF